MTKPKSPASATRPSPWKAASHLDSLSHPDDYTHLHPFSELTAACDDLLRFPLLPESGNTPGVTRENLLALSHKHAREWLVRHPEQ